MLDVRGWKLVVNVGNWLLMVVKSGQLKLAYGGWLEFFIQIRERLTIKYSKSNFIKVGFEYLSETNLFNKLIYFKICFR